jgi:murein DD-endopeptidase MepM/ murein hydrolase activator NlpD
MKNKLRYLLTTIVLMTLSACAQNPFTALEQQQVSIQDTTLFEQFDAFTVDFAAMERDYSFPLPVGRARQVRDYLVEIDTRSGDAVKAMFPGRVRLAKNGHESLGNVIVIRHDNGLETVYGHNSQLLVKSGDRVKAGQTIAIVGTKNRRSYGLFAIMVNGNRINPETIISLESHRLRPQTLLFQKSSDWKVDLSVLKEPTQEQYGSLHWWCYPLPGAKVISPYGRRGGRRHTGTDLKTTNKDEILAAFDGEVVFSGPFAAYGNLVRIRHNNGLETYYSHNSKNLVKTGDWVRAGQVIALTGQTGRATTPHLHFETRINGQAVNSATYFDHTNHTLRLEAFSKKKDGYVIKRK